MTGKKPWTQPKLIRINPFGGSAINPYEYNGDFYGANLTIVFTGGLGDGTVVGAGPNGNITDYDLTIYVTDFYSYSTVAPYS